ncbi:N-acetylmuramoyl-L-alanine amidase [Sporosarcina saromensis]|uniref:N-acetylmuramoyl-L-alanine amidase n=1 Tax=Sporosarcina saromensis TaxID=359365 RepID=A0ABU4GEK1_9BACL|nr:N-acetylmuramoyl-L-alanine amidase [Sporosarcina saromensis]MDW0114037.1 N-acetylmuramoyl-L-alanine amidase [Sporosarcina saromensis]
MTRTKWNLFLLTAALLLALALLPSNADASTSGWVKTNGQWSYSENGNLITGWKNVDSKWYFMDNHALMKTGWVAIQGKWYFFNSNGAMKTGWLFDHGKWYFLNSSGAMQSGWLKDRSVWYYMGAGGKMITGSHTISGKDYYFRENGSMHTGWLTIEGKKRYYTHSGMKQIGHTEISGKEYLFDSEGYLKTNSWYESDGYKYYFSANGELAKGPTIVGNDLLLFNELGQQVIGELLFNGTTYRTDDNGVVQLGWVLTEDGKSYFGENGFITSNWLKDQGKWYYFDENGKMKTGWVHISGKWYFMDNEGVMQTGWLEEPPTKYFLNSNGTMQTGWKKMNSEWHFFMGSGRHMTGWVYNDNKWYYLNSEGIMQTGWITINGKKEYFTKSGDWIKGKADRKVVVLDAGHGGSDPGAKGIGFFEKELNLDLALRTRSLLEKAGYTVIMTRTTDEFLSLSQRASIANSSDGDIFISIHGNSLNGAVKGVETFWYGKYEKENSLKLAGILQKNVIKQTNMVNRRVAEGNFHVIRETKIPSALLEVGFIDNEEDAAKLRQDKYKRLIAEGIYQSVQDYFTN